MGTEAKITVDSSGHAAMGLEDTQDPAVKEWDLVALTPSFIKSEHAQYANAIVTAL